MLTPEKSKSVWPRHVTISVCTTQIQRSFSADMSPCMDETWAHHFDPETKQQSKQWKHVTSPTPVKFRKIDSAGKVMASVFWDSEGVLMIDYLQRGKTVTGVYYA